MANQAEKLSAHPFGQAQGTEGKGDSRGEEGQWRHQEVLPERRRQPRRKEQLADQEKDNHVQPVAR